MFEISQYTLLIDTREVVEPSKQLNNDPPRPATSRPLTDAISRLR